jgi:hypothetical protein
MATDNTSASPIPIAGGSNSVNGSGFLPTINGGWAQLGLILDGANVTFYVGGVSGGGGAVATTFVSPLMLQLGNDASGDVMTGGCGEFLAGNADWTSNVSAISSYLLGRWGV